MRSTLLAVLALVCPAFAQHGPHPIGFNGNVLHPGIPLSGPPRGSGLPHGSAPPFRNGAGRIGGRRPFTGGAVYVPYPVYGYGFDGFYNPPPAPLAPYDPGYSDSNPVVIINQDFQTDTVRPQFRDYSNTPLPEPGVVMVPPPAAPQAPQPGPQLADDQPTIFLIAMQDRTILPVIAYWVQGDTLHYITVSGDPNQVSFALVDRDFSKQLNAERHVPFALPAAR